MLGIAVWVSMTMFTTPTSSQSSPQQAAIPALEQPQSPPSESAPLIQTEQPATETLSVGGIAQSPEVPAAAEDQPAPRKGLQTAAIQARPKRAASDKTAPAKPKVTVDDLINDN